LAITDDALADDFYPFHVPEPGECDTSYCDLSVCGEVQQWKVGFVDLTSVDDCFTT
jgi:hypothetical protein